MGFRKGGKPLLPRPHRLLPRQGHRSQGPQPHSSHSLPRAAPAASPAVWGHAVSRARGLWKASSSAHYRNLIWIPRDQEDLVESGCHKGRDAEANPKPANPRHPRAFLELRHEARQRARCPSSTQLGGWRQQGPRPLSRGSRLAAQQGSRDRVWDPLGIGLKKMHVPSPLPHFPNWGNANKGPTATKA